MTSMRPYLLFCIRGLLCAVMSMAGAAQAATALWMDFVPADPSLQPPSTRLYQAPADTFQFTSKSPGGLSVNVNPFDATVSLAPPNGQTFAIGPYEAAANSSSAGTAPRLSVSRNDAYCSAVTGRYVILEVVYDSNFEMVSFAANVEARCSSGGTFYAELRYNSSIPLTVNEASGAATPDPFAFTPRLSATPSSVAVSNSITVYGINSTVPVSITGGEYSRNGGAYTSSNGSASNRDRITVRATASSAYSTTTTATLAVGGVSAPFNITTYTPGVPFTAVAMDSATATNMGSYGNVEARPPEWTITASHSSGRELQVQVQGPGSRSYSIFFGAPLAQQLAMGPYEEAVRSPFRGASPGLEVYGSLNCYISVGRFVVHELDLADNGVVNRFAASFEQWCGSGEPVFGEVRLNSPLPLPSMVTTADATPDPFALKAQMPVRAGALVRSNWITINGVNRPVPISITGGEYSLNGGPFTSSPGTANLHDDIIVQLQASRTPGAARSATLTAGGVSASLLATTYQQGMILNGLYYRSTSGDYVGQGLTRAYLAPPNGLMVTRNYNNGVSTSVTGVRGVNWTLDMAAAGSATLVPGVYESATRYPFNPSTQNGLSLYGDGRSCNQAAGRFTVLEATYLAGGAPQNFAADFEQRCEGSNAPLFGEVRYGSTTPFSFLLGNECTAGQPECVADLSVELSASTINAGTGKDVVLTFTTTNHGPATAHSVFVGAMLPSAYIAWNSRECEIFGNAIGCNVATLPPGASVRHRLVIRPTAAGSITMNATVRADETDPSSANNSSAVTISVSPTPAGVAITRYRLYSPVTQEHHFTTDLNEYNVLGGYPDTWTQEGPAGKVLDNPGAFNGVAATPYYRLYNTDTRWHHWTSDANEYYTLIDFPGWSGEGVDGYIFRDAASGTIPLYRLMYPHVPGLHHWTINAGEYNALTTNYGWIGEGGSGFVIQ